MDLFGDEQVSNWLVPDPPIDEIHASIKPDTEGNFHLVTRTRSGLVYRTESPCKMTLSDLKKEFPHAPHPD